MGSGSQTSRKAASTMADIARLAGVSEATVSRALSDSPLVNDGTRDRIKTLAREMGYVINAQARNFRLRRTGTIAVAVPLSHANDQRLSDPFFMEMVGSLADAFNEHGFDILLSRVDANDRRWTDRLREGGRCDGIVVVGQSSQHASLNALAEGPVPVVVWGARLPDQAYPTVGVDNEIGGRLVTEHLIRLGRRRIAFLGDPAAPEVGQRRAGYAAALEAAGLAPDPALEYPARFISDEAYRGVEALLSRGAPPDAIVAASDILAMTAIIALGEKGLRVPADVGVTGFDDIAMAGCYNPPLTTIRQHVGQGGRLLADMLLSRLRGEEVTPITLTPELVVRSSSGALPEADHDQRGESQQAQ